MGKATKAPEYTSPGDWTPELDGDYNPADFIIPASDHQGHSERLYFRAQPQHERALSVIMKSRKFPFRTSGDMLRWSFVRGLKVLNHLDPMPGFLGAADAIGEILKQEIYLQEFMHLFGTMEKVIQSHIAAGAGGEARRLLSVVLAQLEKIDEPYWKKKAQKEVRQRFGHLLESKGDKVSLRGPTPNGTKTHDTQDDD